jgi:hypothetical protein
MEIGGKGGELADAERVASFGNGDEVGGSANINAGGIDVEVREMGGGGCRRATRCGHWVAVRCVARHGELQRKV